MNLDKDKNLNEKQKIERAILDRFLKEYNEKHHCDYAFYSHRDKPDFEIISQSKKYIVGIEVTRLWETNDDPKSLLGREKNNIILPIRTSKTVQQTLEELIIKKNNDVEKFNYEKDVSLVIGENSPSEMLDVIDLNKIKIPKMKKLKHVFIISSYKGLIQLR